MCQLCAIINLSMIKEMRASMRKKMLSALIVFSVLFSTISVKTVSADDEETPVVIDDKSEVTIDENHSSGIDLENEVTVDLPLEDPVDENLEEEPVMFFSAYSSFTPKIMGINGTGADELVYLYDSATSSSTITYISNKASYNADAAVLAEQGNRYKIKLAGVVGWVNKASFMTLYSADDVSGMSHYYVSSNGDLIHRLSKNVTSNSYSEINNGVASKYLVKGTTYYSYDGNYFYTNRNTMLNDYAKGNTNNAVNSGSPFYNYFQYLPYRTQTSITAQQLDSYIVNTKKYTALIADKTGNNIPANESNMYGAGKLSVDIGNKYGANALITFGIAIHESGWGKSYLAASRNNLFGHAAYDSYPGAATGYKNVEDSFSAHHTNFLHWHYMDVYFKETAYRGGYLGNKESGLNVRYASDAYWGEKIAAHMLTLDRATGNKDYGKYKIGMKGDSGIRTNIRMEPTTNSSIVKNYVENYEATLNKGKHSVLILDTVTGEKVGTSNTWYKVAMDSLIDPATRNLLSIFGSSVSNGKVNRFAGYDYGKSYGYVHSGQLTETMYKGNGVVDYGKTPEKPPVEPPVEPPVDPPVEPEFGMGDINGDNKITTIDIVMVQRHLMGIERLSGSAFNRALLAKRESITTLDFVILQRHILGIQLIR